MPDSTLTTVAVHVGDHRTKVGQVWFASYIKDDRSTGYAEWTYTSASYSSVTNTTTLTSTGRDLGARDSQVSFGNGIGQMMG